MKQVDVVIWGDFPPNTYNGISTVNASIENILVQGGRHIIRIDESAWQLSSAKKFLHYLSCALNLFKVLVSKKCRILYFNMPLSRFGLLRLAFLLPIVRLVSFRTNLLGHIHRGDLKQFSERSYFNRLLLKFCMKITNRTIVLSENYVDDVKGLNSSIDVVVLRNTSSIESNSIIDFNRIYTRRFLCISNYIRSKGIGELIASFSSKELESFSLTVFGNIYEPSFFDELIKRKTKNITLEHKVLPDALAKTIKEFDCLILSSWNEGQPLVILEAMSLGIPIIATNVGDIPNMLGNDYPFLVKPRDLESLKNNVLKFDRFQNKVELGRNLYQSYMNRYSNNKFHETVNSIFV